MPAIPPPVISYDEEGTNGTMDKAVGAISGATMYPYSPANGIGPLQPAPMLQSYAPVSNTAGVPATNADQDMQPKGVAHIADPPFNGYEHASPLVIEPIRMSTSPEKASEAPTRRETIEPDPITDESSGVPTRARLPREAKNKQKSWQMRGFSSQTECEVSDAVGDQSVKAYRISLKSGLTRGTDERKKLSKDAVEAELKQLHEVKAFKPVYYKDIPADHRRRIIPCHLFLKEKYKADGTVDRMKGRLVAGGDQVDVTQLGDTRSPTVNQATVMMMINLVAANDLKMVTADITGAFLVPVMSSAPEDITYIQMDSTLSKLLSDLFPMYRPFLTPRGDLYILLKRYLYGLPQAAYMFNKHLTETMIKIGFAVTAGDVCCFIRGIRDSKLIVCVHVDDLMIIGKDEPVRELMVQIGKEYAITIQTGGKQSYLGLDIRMKPDGVYVYQTGYRRDILEKYEVYVRTGRVVKAPAEMDLMDAAPDTDENVPSRTYAGIVMSLMYLARLTRYDLLFATVVHSTRCSNPKATDMAKVVHTLKYLKNAQNMGLKFEKKPVRLGIMADASHGSHHDGRGHGCIAVSLGSAAVVYRTFKLKLTTLSSTESEHVVLCDAATYNIWIRKMLKDMGVSQLPQSVVFQDNTSTISMVTNPGNFLRNKHILIRRNFARDEVEKGEMRLQYRPSHMMDADVGTKVLSLESFSRHVKSLGLVSMSEE
jgi:hypothetical protein